MAHYTQGTMHYNTGGESPATSSQGAQLQDFHFERIAIIEARKMKTFSQMGRQRKQPKHYGTTIKRYREYPIMHPSNINDEGIDGDGVKMTKGMWYSWDAAGVRVEHATKALAKARAGQVRIQSGDGNLIGGSRDFNVQNGAFPSVGEDNAVVNLIGRHRDVVTAKINRFAFGRRYTQTAVDLDTDGNLLVKESQEIGVAYGEIREAQIRNGLITAGMTNATYTGAATSIATINEMSLVTYSDFRMLRDSLYFARMPMDTKIITGSTKIDTKVVKAGRYIFIPQELLSTLEDMTHNGRSVWKDLSEYADAGTIAEGEVGAIGDFRFIVVYDMPKWAGEGEDATDGADADGDGVEDAGQNMHVTDGKYDAFPMLVVGSEAFETIGLEGSVAKVRHSPPRPNSDTDLLGDRGSFAIAWWFGLLINKPEWIRVIVTGAIT